MGIGELFEFEKTGQFEERHDYLRYGHVNRITKQRGLISQVLVCSACKQPVEKGFMSGQTPFFSCYHCDSWVSHVEWKDEPILT